MILIDIEVYNNVKGLYEIFEAIVDTGATFSVIAEHIAKKIGSMKAVAEPVTKVYC